MRYSFILAGFVLALSGMLPASCKKSSGGSGPTGPDDGINPDTLTRHRNMIAWIDCRSNVFGTYGRFNDTDQIKLVLDTMQATGFTGIVLDVKGSAGYTMYPSAYAKQFTSFDGKTLPAGLDYTAFMVREAHKRNFSVYASIVTFVEGDGGRSFGTVYDDPAFRSQYESIVCDASGNRVPVTSTGKNAFVNPAQPAVQERALNIIREIVTKYNVDGLLLDYARYCDINADFSDFSKNQFADYLKKNFSDNTASYMNFPGDIVSSWKVSSGQILPASTGKYYNKWLMYRAGVIHDFFKKARETVKAAKPNVAFGVYSGAWYGTIYQVGVNWASEEYDPFNDQTIRFDWAYPGYGKTGYTEQLDILMTGNYFTQIMLADNPATANTKYSWWNIEGSINGTQYVTMNKVPLYGSLDMGNTDWANAGEITKAMKYVLSRTSGGIMIFDIVHVYAPQYNRLKIQLWDALKAGTKQ